VNEKLLTDYDREIINKENINLYTLDLLKKKNFEKIIKSIFNQVKYYNVHIIFDMAVFSNKLTPSAIRHTDNNNNNNTDNNIIIDGLDIEQLNIILKNIMKIEKY
jgi:hypothetical protein